MGKILGILSLLLGRMDKSDEAASHVFDLLQESTQKSKAGGRNYSSTL